jgi:DNA-binding MarR family transcriptional regulator
VTRIDEDHIDRMIAAWGASAPGTDVSDLSVAGRLLRCSSLLQQRIEQALRPLDLSFGDFDVINTVRREGGRDGLHPTTLSAQALITTGAMTTRLNRLERNGLIVRQADPADGRAVLVRLTRLGRARAEKALAAVLEVDRDFLAPLPEDRREEVAAALRLLLLAHEPA